MGRRLFLQHLREATASPPSSISHVHSPDEAVVAFTFSYVQQSSPHVCSARLLALDVDEYPEGNSYMLFTEDDHVDPVIAGSFEHIAPRLTGIALPEALSNISIALHDFVSKGLAGNPIDLDAEEVEHGYDFEDDFLDDQDSGNEDFGFIDSLSDPVKEQRRVAASNKVMLDKIKGDLRATRKAGFRVGIIGDLVTGGIITVSVRVTKLGLSGEAMRAWGLQKEHYLVLLIRFRRGYRNLEQVASETKLSDQVQIQVGLCKSYKPSDQDAYDAFDKNAMKGHSSNLATALEPLFISTPLNDLFRERFSSVVRFRQLYGLNWRSAEAMVHDIQGKAGNEDAQDADSYVLPDDVSDRALPPIIMDDELHTKAAKDTSLPLVAMQFLLRHFVRCTEFCLVCHCQVEATFEALKPYVCSKPLCLYQYMSLGFGPSIEWEVLSEPYVVDLLVSFCYAAARQERLKEFPVGIDLKSEEMARFQAGDWLVVDVGDIKSYYYYQIDEIGFPIWQLGKPCMPKGPRMDRQSESSSPVESASKETLPVDCYVYDANFDEMNKAEKCQAIITILDALPSVLDMKSYLERKGSGKDRTLKSWKTHLSHAGLNVLRWIIASNRSCIVQVEPLFRRGQAGGPPLASSSAASCCRVSGMDEWLQFRFAQGAPDKEQRFVDCVERETRGTKYPTLFAWHGSALANWHSIIREGLRFEEIVHGRAFGNGVYMSNRASTSVGYTNMSLAGRAGKAGKATESWSLKWPQSVLGITGALSLQEVVNKTGAFVSASPHYVVANTDWIQTRYLFIKSDLRRSRTHKTRVAACPQDPKRLCLNESDKPIEIPVTAGSNSHRAPVSKRIKRTASVHEQRGEGQEDEDASSIMSDADDRAFLESEVEGMSADSSETDEAEADEQTSHPGSKRSLFMREKDKNTDGFVPDSLCFNNIKFLDPPRDALTSATNALQRALKEAVKVQKTTPLSTLGWYIHAGHISNLYQWIVELHSFDERLPLAKDMKTAGIRSITLEMRFTNQFPYAPPFIRVVQPRFLPFSAAVTSIEMVLLQVRLAMSEEERPARLLANAKARHRPGYGGDSYGVALYTNNMGDATPVNGSVPHSATISHLSSYPAVADAASAFQSSPVGAKSIQLTDNAFNKYVKPNLHYLDTPASYAKPYVQKADELGDKLLTRIDETVPIIKSETKEIKSTITSYVFWPLHKTTETKDWALQTYNSEYKKCGGDGLVASSKALVTTPLILGSEVLQWLSTLLQEKSNQATETLV
ncbi:hypothetical protein DV738_g4113, partial [Chaetothyriales sp. CBS 135597]